MRDRALLFPGVPVCNIYRRGGATEKERQTKDDGRYIIFYSFGEKEERAAEKEASEDGSSIAGEREKG